MWLESGTMRYCCLRARHRRLRASKRTDAFTALQISAGAGADGADCSVPGTATTVSDPGIRDRRASSTSLCNDGSTAAVLPSRLLVVNNLVLGRRLDGRGNEQHHAHPLHRRAVRARRQLGRARARRPSTRQTITDLISPGGSIGASLNIITPTHSQCLQAQVPHAGT